MKFSDLKTEEQNWLDTYLDGTISPDDFEALQNRMAESPELRAVMRRYLSVDSSLASECGVNGNEADAWLDQENPPSARASESRNKILIFPRFVPVAAAAALAFFLGLGIMHWRNGTDPDAINGEASAQGFAVVGKLFDPTWESADSRKREGDLLGSEVFQLASGTAEIQFFSGAVMTIEGPAEISLKSAWEASCREGAVRMKVPPAARGFKLHAPSSEIIDLGTEFGLQVRDGVGHVEVFDGEIAVRHNQEEEQLMKKGASFSLDPDGPAIATNSGELSFPDVRNFGTRALDEVRSDFDRWKSHRDSLAQDGRLIAYYTFDRDQSEGLIPNLTMPRNPEFDGAVILAEPVDGRWPGMKSALEFRRPGSRVRVNIPGEYSAFTFSSWVRIDSLDRVYNALFMGDGYETGEPHWQIREDGALMLSVMVDDSKPNPGAPHDAGLHRVYYSPPVWEMAMAGQWLHLASVFDPGARAVSHYVNGKQVSTQKITDKFLVEKLRIGNAEIGNWGLPFREDPWFAIRHLNGRMDEFAIFREALSEDEIASLYEQSRAGRR